MNILLNTFAMGIGKIDSLNNFEHDIYHHHFSIPVSINNSKYMFNLKTNTKLLVIQNVNSCKFIDLMKEVEEDLYMEESNKKIIHFDYYRDMNLLPGWIESHEINEENNIFILKKLFSEGDKILAYGSFYGNDTVNTSLVRHDKHKDLPSIKGIHFLHMNQGWNENSEYYSENVINYDGVVIIKDREKDIYTMILSVQAGAILPTNSFGQPIENNTSFPSSQ